MLLTIDRCWVDHNKKSKKNSQKKIPHLFKHIRGAKTWCYLLESWDNVTHWTEYLRQISHAFTFYTQQQLDVMSGKTQIGTQEDTPVRALSFSTFSHRLFPPPLLPQVLHYTYHMVPSSPTQVHTYVHTHIQKQGSFLLSYGKKTR